MSSHLLVSIFLDFWIHNGLLWSCQHWVKLGFEAGTAVLRAAPCTAEWRRNADRYGQILSPRRWKDCQELCTPEMSMYVGRQILICKMNVKPLGDNLQGNPSYFHAAGVRIGLEGPISSLQRATFILSHPLFILKNSLSDCLSDLCA